MIDCAILNMLSFVFLIEQSKCIKIKLKYIIETWYDSDMIKTYVPVLGKFDYATIRFSLSTIDMFLFQVQNNFEMHFSTQIRIDMTAGLLLKTFFSMKNVLNCFKTLCFKLLRFVIKRIFNIKKYRKILQRNIESIMATIQ